MKNRILGDRSLQVSEAIDVVHIIVRRAKWKGSKTSRSDRFRVTRDKMGKFGTQYPHRPTGLDRAQEDVYLKVE